MQGADGALILTMFIPLPGPPALVNPLAYAVGSINGGGGGSIPPPFPSIIIQEFPAVGALTAVSGTVLNLVNPTHFQAVLYELDAGGENWWSKPDPGATVPVAPDTSFSFIGWASVPASDAQGKQLAVFIIPNTADVIPGGLFLLHIVSTCTFTYT